jgi:hypothetical protein
MRIFDSGKERQATTARRSREEVLAAAKQVEDMLKEAGELDEASQKLGDRLAQAQQIQAVHYKKFRVPGSKWLLEHACDGQDYVIQMFPLRPPTLDVPDILTLLIGTMDAIFPRSVHIRYTPPAKDYQIKFYTVRIENVVGMPGWEQAVTDRALRGLSHVQAW